MTRKIRLALAAGALLAPLVGASPVVAAGSGADFGACRRAPRDDDGRIQWRTQSGHAPGSRRLAGLPGRLRPDPFFATVPRAGRSLTPDDRPTPLRPDPFVPHAGRCPVPPTRDDRVSPPPAPGGWDIRYAADDAVDSFLDFAAHMPGPTRDERPSYLLTIS